MAYNKVVYGAQVLIDLTADTVDPEHLLLGKTAHDQSGEVITGTCSYDADTGDATAAASGGHRYDCDKGGRVYRSGRLS